MKFLLSAVVSTLLFTVAAHAQVVLEELRLRSWEAKTLYLPIYEHETITTDSPSLTAKIKGVVSRPSQTIEVSPRAFADVETLVRYVLKTYCQAEHVPAGTSEFNAGRNISVVLENYVPARLSITITMRAEDAVDQQRKHVTCANAIRD